ncbi:hypothetical protein CROQUDRAFT_723465 [Cronartium quercuum f. sp. fusiforme G11]|uniref:Zn(2)-C6 fungal-type domain-containing protein n=1 Tax=Cronartium quercuum f. sp. fusiforme G11 TaxID=708437 RepID=A0A9P6NG94_9BASI|nr:hypothetical protein CROQUDRAFT_723465 [Cronartium quercuum f. sp. fusiforme G11]
MSFLSLLFQLSQSRLMKCEGPNHAPCRRCVRNNVDCVFGESQGRARQILWSKRTEELERKVMRHEEELNRAMALIQEIQQRIPGLTSQPLKTSLTPVPTESPEPTPSLIELPTSNKSDLSPPATHSVASKARTVSCSPYPKVIAFCQAIRAAKPGPRRSDLVDRGKFSESRAKELFEVHRSDWAPQIPWLNLPDTFDNVRLHSPLMLAVGCSTGAKGMRDVVAYRKAKANVIELVIDVLCYRYFPHDQPQSYQDVIAVIGCIVHCGLGLDPALVVDYAEHLRLRDVFDRIPEERWQKESDQRQLLSIARTFIGVYIHTVLFSTLTAKPCVMRMDKTVLMLYCDIICQSPYSEPAWDKNLKYFVQYYALMEEAQIRLDSHYRLGSIDLAERFAAIEKYSALIHSWKIDWERELEARGREISPDAVIEFQLMYHRGMTYLACFATAESRDGREIFSNARRLRLARQGVTHGLAILEQFIESRLAQPHLPCVHLEYRKATMCIATACIVEACLLIPDHINFAHCLRIIKQLTDELRKEGDEWGGGTEDSYVTTLQKLSAQLDAAQAERLKSQHEQGTVGEGSGETIEEIEMTYEKDNVLPPVPASQIPVQPNVVAQGSSQMPRIVMAESRGSKKVAENVSPLESGTLSNVIHAPPPVSSISSSGGLINSHDLVTSGWLVQSDAYAPSRDLRHEPATTRSEIEHHHESIVTESSPTNLFNPACQPPLSPWVNPIPSSPGFQYSPSTPDLNPLTHLHHPSDTSALAHRMYPDSNPYESYPYQTHQLLPESFQNPVTLHQPNDFHDQVQPGNILTNSAFVVPEQTSSLIQSLRSVYPDRLIQTCFQTSL